MHVFSCALRLVGVVGRSLPGDSERVRAELAAGEPRIDCEASDTSLPPMSLGSVDSTHCEASAHACYLLSQKTLAGSTRSLECLGLTPDVHGSSLPSYPMWGFVSPTCWSYVRISRKWKRPPSIVADAETRYLADAAAQEWTHPTDQRSRRGLRVVVSSRCLPFLLEDLPHILAQGRHRRDTLATTVSRLRNGSRLVEEERRVTVVERVIVDAAAEGELRRARRDHADSLNAVVVASNELPHDGNGLQTVSALLGAARSQRARAQRGAFVLGINALAIAVNAFVAVRAVYLWRIVERNRVIEWIERASPHMPVTIRAASILNGATMPFRRLAALVVAPLAHAARIRARPPRGIGQPPPPLSGNLRRMAVCNRP